MSDLTTTSLPVLPLRSGIVFPQMVITVSVESDTAKRALAATSGNKRRAAQLLGISRHRLYDKIRKYGIDSAATSLQGVGVRSGREPD